MTSRQHHVASFVIVMGFAFMALGTGKAKEDSSSTTSKRDTVATSGTSENAATTEKPAPASEFDAIGAEKDWGSIHATLKEAGVKGSVGTASILLKNTGPKEDNISSLMQLQMTNEEGDRGEMDMMNTSCDGKIPPNGLLKCKLAYTFDKPPKDLTIALGTGLGAKTVYFKVKTATPAAPAATGKAGK